MGSLGADVMSEKFRTRDGLYHVVHELEDDGLKLLVVKIWGRRKQRWYYSVMTDSWAEALKEIYSHGKDI